MNILVLMAGSSDTFRKAGYAYPKALTEVGGEPMVDKVVRGLEPLRAQGARLIFAVRREDNAAYHLGEVINLLDPDAKIVETSGDTAGAACTALLAVDFINSDEPLVIVNGDQLIDADVGAVVEAFKGKSFDGGIIVFRGIHPRWSFVRLNTEGLVVEAAEKRPISRLATAGFYYFARGRDFVAAAFAMIRKGAHVDGSYFVCPAYNQLILNGGRIGVAEISPQQYHSLATPTLVESYEGVRHIRLAQE